MDFDHTLPMKGGWIMTKDVAPCRDSAGHLLQPMPLSIYWGMPEKLSVRGSHTLGVFIYNHVKERDLRRIWKKRCGGKLDAFEADGAEKFERDFEDHFEEELELEMRVRIRTPQGDLNLLPPEWTPVKDIKPYLEQCDGEQMRIVELGGLKDSKKIADQMHYARSRGIDRATAFQMIAGTIERPNVFFIEPHPQLVEYFGFTPVATA